MTSISVANLDFAQVFELSPVMITATEAATGRVVACNQQLVETTGFPKTQIIGRQTVDLIHPDSRQDARDVFERFRAGEPISKAEFQLACANGGRVDVGLKIRALHQGSNCYHLTAWHDISAAKEVERTLRESQHKLRAVLDNTTAVVYVKDPAGRYLLINRRFAELFHISREDIQGKTDHEVFPREQADAFRQNDLSVLTTNQVIEFEELAPHPDGLHTYISLKFPIHDDAGNPNGVAGISTDITERKQLEKEVSEISSHEQHRISRELHDGLGQQLTGLAYLAKSLAKRLAASSLPEAESAETIRQGMRDAVGEVRRVVRGLAPIRLDAFGLKAALEDLVDSIGRRFDVPCDLRCRQNVAVADDLVATQLYRIAQEALNNAVKHSQASHIAIDLASRGRDLKMQIRDDGCGILKDATEDGMGLRIMRYRSTMIGAKLRVVSSRGKGTIVTCTLKQDIADGGSTNE